MNRIYSVQEWGVYHAPTSKFGTPSFFTREGLAKELTTLVPFEYQSWGAGWKRIDDKLQCVDASIDITEYIDDHGGRGCPIRFEEGFIGGTTVRHGYPDTNPVMVNSVDVQD